MKIVAESQPAIAARYVHLGYLAASSFLPRADLCLTGSMLAVVGMGMVFKLVKIKNRRGKTLTEMRPRRTRIGAIGMGVLLVSIGCIVLSWMTGRRHYEHPRWVTSDRMEAVLKCINIERNYPPAEYTKEQEKQLKSLLGKAGEHDLLEVVQVFEAIGAIRPQSGSRVSKDGWGGPMKLRVIVADGQQPDYILMSAGEDGKWNTGDDVTSLDYAEKWKRRPSSTTTPATQ